MNLNKILIAPAISGKCGHSDGESTATTFLPCASCPWFSKDLRLIYKRKLRAGLPEQQWNWLQINMNILWFGNDWMSYKMLYSSRKQTRRVLPVAHSATSRRWCEVFFELLDLQIGLRHQWNSRTAGWQRSTRLSACWVWTQFETL